MRSEHRHRSINNKLILMIVLAASALLVTIIIVIYLYVSGYFYQKKPIPLSVALVSEDTKSALSEAPFQAEAILKRTEELLSESQKTEPFIVSWYMLPGSVLTMKPAASDYIITRDQVDLLKVYIAMDKKEKASVLMEAIDEKLVDTDGYLLSAIPVSVLTEKQIASIPELEIKDIRFSSSYFDTLLYTQALIAYYEKWGSEDGFRQLEEYSKLLYSEQSLVPPAFQIPAPTPTPIPQQFLADNPSVIEQDGDKQDVYEYIPLSSLYLSTLQSLSAIDSRYSGKYEQAKKMIQDAVISDTVPLYATAYDPEQGGYLYVSDRESSFHLVPVLETCLHLAEVDKLPDSTLLWLKERLLNQQILYEKYDVIFGEATSDQEAYEAYAIAIAISVWQNDAALCRASINAQANHLATNTNSQVKDALFRTVQTNRISLYARENLLLILALTTETKNEDKS